MSEEEQVPAEEGAQGEMYRTESENETDGADAEAAENFLMSFSQAETTDLTPERALRYEWLTSSHLKGCKRSTQVGQLCIFATKAKISDMSELQELSATVATAQGGAKTAARRRQRC